VLAQRASVAARVCRVQRLDPTVPGETPRVGSNVQPDRKKRKSVPRRAHDVHAQTHCVRRHLHGVGAPAQRGDLGAPWVRRRRQRVGASTAPRVRWRLGAWVDSFAAVHRECRRVCRRALDVTNPAEAGAGPGVRRGPGQRVAWAASGTRLAVCCECVLTIEASRGATLATRARSPSPAWLESEHRVPPAAQAVPCYVLATKLTPREINRETREHISSWRPTFWPTRLAICHLAANITDSPRAKCRSPQRKWRDETRKSLSVMRKWWRPRDICRRACVMSRAEHEKLRPIGANSALGTLNYRSRKKKARCAEHLSRARARQCSIAASEVRVRKRDRDRGE
jgi:hypothetical protein